MKEIEPKLANELLERMEEHQMEQEDVMGKTDKL